MERGNKKGTFALLRKEGKIKKRTLKDSKACIVKNLFSFKAPRDHDKAAGADNQKLPALSGIHEFSYILLLFLPVKIASRGAARQLAGFFCFQRNRYYNTYYNKYYFFSRC